MNENTTPPAGRHGNPQVPSEYQPFKRPDEPPAEKYLRHIRNATVTLAVIAVAAVVLSIIGVVTLSHAVDCLSTQSSLGCTP